jgi:hypothetical protein
MIRNLRGFVARPTASGYLLAPADAPGSGVIRYEARVRPLRRVSEMVAPRLPPPFVETSRTPIVPFVTAEGEDGARLTVHGRGVQRDFAFVFGDDFAATLDASSITDGPRFTAAVATLADGVTLGMPLRRRRFRYQPPAGWMPFVRGLETDWTSPDGRQRLTVFPAERAGLEHVAVVAARHGVPLDPASTPALALAGHRAVAGRVAHGWLALMELSAPPFAVLEATLATAELPRPPAGIPSFQWFAEQFDHG